MLHVDWSERCRLLPESRASLAAYERGSLRIAAESGHAGRKSTDA
jgi:hypothetical protein